MRLFLPSQTHVFYEYNLGTMGRMYITSLTTLVDPNDPVDFGHIEDLRTSMASVYEVLVSGSLIGYAVAPTKGQVKNLGSCLYVMRSRWRALPIGERVRRQQDFDLKYRMGPLRIYNYSTDGLAIGIVRPNKFTEVLDQ